MDKKSILIASSILILVVIGMFTFAYLKNNELEIDKKPTQKDIPVEVSYPYITRIDAKHFFENGMHTVAGNITFPTPCDLLKTSTIIKESFPEQVTVEFNVLNNSETCIQVVTDQRFKASFNADINATIDALFMNRKIDLNLIEAGVDESPDDFELFIKG